MTSTKDTTVRSLLFFAFSFDRSSAVLVQCFLSRGIGTMPAIDDHTAPARSSRALAAPGGTVLTTSSDAEASIYDVHALEKFDDMHAPGSYAASQAPGTH